MRSVCMAGTQTTKRTDFQISSYLCHEKLAEKKQNLDTTFTSKDIRASYQEI
jgi:hypothetical protein